MDVLDVLSNHVHAHVAELNLVYASVFRLRFDNEENPLHFRLVIAQKRQKRSLDDVLLRLIASESIGSHPSTVSSILSANASSLLKLL